MIIFKISLSNSQIRPFIASKLQPRIAPFSYRDWIEEHRETRETMSGAGKKIVDGTFKVSKNIDWEGMAKLLVSDEARKEFFTLRRAFDEVNTQLQTKFSQVFFSLFITRFYSFISPIWTVFTWFPCEFLLLLGLCSNFYICCWLIVISWNGGCWELYWMVWFEPHLCRFLWSDYGKIVFVNRVFIDWFWFSEMGFL